MLTNDGIVQPRYSMNCRGKLQMELEFLIMLYMAHQPKKCGAILFEMRAAQFTQKNAQNKKCRDGSICHHLFDVCRKCLYLS